MTMSPQQQQFILFLRNQIAQGSMTREQAQERFAALRTSVAHPFHEQNVQQISSGFTTGGMAGGSAQQQMAALPQRPQAPASNPMNSLHQRVIQTQDSIHARQLNMLVAQGQQQQQNGFASRVGQTLHPPGMGLPQGQGSLQQNFIQPSPSVPPANLQSSAAPSAPQPTQLGGPQIHNLPKNISEIPIPQLTILYNSLVRAVEDGERNFNAVGGTGGESDMQRQALRAKIDNQKQTLSFIRDFINLKRQGGDPAQQALNGAPWLGAGQRTTGLYSVTERPPQHNSPSNQPSVLIPPQRSIPTPQQNFVPSVTAQSNLTQMSPRVSGNGLPFNGALAPIPGAPPQPPPQAPHPPQQQSIQCSKLPALPEDRFKVLFAQFASTTGIKLNERDFVIDGRPINPWALHRAVFARNGFDTVTANDEWAAVGAVMGFPTFSAGDPTQPSRCAPTIAHRLQQLYHDSLRHFEQAYINNFLTRLRNSQALGQVSAQPSQQQAQAHQPTDADYQALLASIQSEPSVVNAEAMSILPRFSHTSGADLEARRVPPHIVAFVEQHRDNLQRAAQGQNEFRAGLTSTKNLPLDNRAQINQASAFQGMARGPPPNHTQLQLPRQALSQAQGKPNTLQPTQLINNGVGTLARPSTAQSMSASSMSSMGTQITGAGSNGGAQSQSGSMSAPLTQGGMNGAASSSIITQSAGAVPTRRLTEEELASAKRWVDEQRRTAFNCSFDRVDGYSQVPDNEIQEYIRNLERLDMVLGNIERYIHIAFAALRKEEVVRRMFAMMACTKLQLEESKKPSPRYVLELHTIRGMIQEADNMDKGLRTVLGFKMAAQGNAPVPQSQQPPSMGPTPSFTQPAPPAAPPAIVGGSRPPPTTPFQQGHRKRQSQAQAPGAAVSTPTPPPVPAVSTPTPATPGMTAPSPQTPKSPKGKATAKPKPPVRRKGSTKASLETASSAPTVTSTPTSLTPVDTKGGVKRVREDEADSATPGVASAPSPKRVKSDWEGPTNEEARKRDEKAENVKTDEQALAFFETVTKFIDENPESAEAASNALDEILRTYPPPPDIDDAMASSFNFGDLPPTSPPHPLDVFGEFIDISAFDDTPTPDLVAGSSTNPSPESTSDQDHPHTGHAGSSPQIPHVKTEDTYELLRPSVDKEISGGDAMLHLTPGWRWEGRMNTSDQAWSISS